MLLLAGGFKCSVLVILGLIMYSIYILFIFDIVFFCVYLCVILGLPVGKRGGIYKQTNINKCIYSVSYWCVSQSD